MAEAPVEHTPISGAVAARLVRNQFPQLSDRPLRHLASAGTDNHIFRLGGDLCARFPKAPWAAVTASREVRALPRFSGAPLAVPEVYGLGVAGEAYPHAWSILTWLPGVPAEDEPYADQMIAARQLADFFSFLRDVPVDAAFRFSAENSGRGAPLPTRTARFQEALSRLPDVDMHWAEQLWAQALRVKGNPKPVWLHGDVHPGNVLIQYGEITGIIDWGLCGVGDGACDLLSAWAMFDTEAREVFRRSLGASEADWLRGAGWALSMAVIYLPYAYEHGLRCDMSEKMIQRLRQEFA